MRSTVQYATCESLAASGLEDHPWILVPHDRNVAGTKTSHELRWLTPLDERRRPALGEPGNNRNLEAYESSQWASATLKEGH